MWCLLPLFNSRRVASGSTIVGTCAIRPAPTTSPMIMFLSLCVACRMRERSGSSSFVVQPVGENTVFLMSQ